MALEKTHKQPPPMAELDYTPHRGRKSGKRPFVVQWRAKQHGRFRKLFTWDRWTTYYRGETQAQMEQAMAAGVKKWGQGDNGFAFRVHPQTVKLLRE